MINRTANSRLQEVVDGSLCRQCRIVSDLLFLVATFGCLDVHVYVEDAVLEGDSHVQIIDDGQFQADIGVVEPTGTDILLYFQVGEEELVVEAQRDGTLGDRDVVRFDIPPDRVHLFSDGDALTSSRRVATH